MLDMLWQVSGGRVRCRRGQKIFEGNASVYATSTLQAEDYATLRGMFEARDKNYVSF